MVWESSVVLYAPPYMRADQTRDGGAGTPWARVTAVVLCDKAISSQVDRFIQYHRRPQLLTRNEAVGVGWDVADRRLLDMIDGSSDEESHATRQAWVAGGLDGDFEDVLPSPPRHRSTCRSIRVNA